MGDVWRRHILDSAQLCRYLPRQARVAGRSRQRRRAFPAWSWRSLGVPDVHLVESRPAQMRPSCARRRGSPARRSRCIPQRIEKRRRIRGRRRHRAGLRAARQTCWTMQSHFYRPTRICLFLKGRNGRRGIDRRRAKLGRCAAEPHPEPVRSLGHVILRLRSRRSCRAASSTEPKRAARRVPGSSPSPTRRAGSARPRPRSIWPPRWPRSASSVLLIDLDPQGNASTGLGIGRAGAAASPAMTCCSARRTLADGDRADARFRGLSIVPGLGRSLRRRARAGRATSAANSACATRSTRVAARYRLRADRLPALARPADPERAGRGGRRAGAAAMRVLRARRPVASSCSTIERVTRHLNPALEIQGVVLTMFDKRNNLSDQVAADVRGHFGDKVYRHRDPAQRAHLRGAVARQAGAALRSALLRARRPTSISPARCCGASAAQRKPVTP